MMKHKRLLALFVWFVIHLYSVSTARAEREAVPPVIQAVRINSAPVIDGRLDDDAWEGATVLRDFYCTDLDRPPTERTEVRLAYGEDGIYAAFYCYDSRPEEIKALETKRGGMIRKDDRVEVELDVAHQHRHRGAYEFRVTANGTQDEYIPGGSASKIEWRGDWKAAVRIVDDGWIAEMFIPFGILSYPKGQTTFGIAFHRWLSREREESSWPNMGDSWDLTKVGDWVGLRLPEIKRPPVVMPYAVGQSSHGSGSDLYAGLDVKKTLRSGLTAGFTVYPDFKNVESEILGLEFSYTERFRRDNRPFFTEGGGFFPSRRMFYSQRVGELILGGKLFGKLGMTNLGLLDVLDSERVNHLAARIEHNLSARSRVSLGVVHRYDGGVNNALLSIRGSRSAQVGRGTGYLSVGFYRSATSGPGGEGRVVEMSVGRWAGNRELGGRLEFSQITAGYNPLDGFMPEEERDQLGFSLRLNYGDRRDKGWLERWRWEGSLRRHVRHGGELYRQGFDTELGFNLRDGLGFDLGYSWSERPPHLDRLWEFDFEWNRHSLYNDGEISLSFGRVESADYWLFSLDQGLRLTESFGVNLDLQHRKRVFSDGTTERLNQSLISLSYDLTAERGLNGRFVRRGKDLNFYLTYRQLVREGLDAFVVMGDPSSSKLEKRLAVKLMYVL